jgi:molybdate/tungstate transport system ATP-binding protein
LQVEGVSKSFGGHSVLKNVTFSVEDGETVVLLGSSGVGKSTLLKIIAGLLRPDSGKIKVNGTVAFDSGSDPFINLPPRSRCIGYVPQDYLLFPFLSAYENITFGLKGKVPDDEMDSTVAPIVSLLEIEDVVKLRPDQLSGGQRQRVALARPLALRPQLLMLDEPMSNLDPELRDRVRIEMRRFFKKLGATTLYVTHDLADAFALGDKVAVLMNGEIRAMESPEQLLKSPRAIEVGRFLGLNCFKAKVVKSTRVDINGLQISTAELPVEAGRDVIVSFRPDCLRPVKAETVISPNVLTGSVLEILPSVGTVNLRINVGIEVHCCLTRRDFDTMRLGENEEIRLHLALEDVNVTECSDNRLPNSGSS